MHINVKKIIILCIVFCTDFYGDPLESVLLQLNETFENINKLLPSPEGFFIQAIVKSTKFPDLLSEATFRKLIGMDFWEAQEIFSERVYVMDIKMIQVIAKRSEEVKQLNIVDQNWDVLKSFFPRYVHVNSFDVADDGTLYANVEFSKDKEGNEKFTLDDCDRIVTELKNLNVIAQCLIQPKYKLMILPPKYKEQRIKNKNDIIKELNAIEKNFSIRYEARGYRITQGKLKPTVKQDLG